MTRSKVNLLEWLTGILVVCLSFIVWVTHTSDFTIYTIFPVLGLIAFGLIWTHFVYGAVRKYLGLKANPGSSYMTISMGIVLALIILHPGLLWYALYQDGLGLPPLSVYKVYDTQVLAVLLGTLGLIIFLSYELKRLFSAKSWWRYVEALQTLGMIVIFIHGILLGSETTSSWFAFVWWFYGVSLLISVGYSVWKDKQLKEVYHEQ